MVQLKAEQTLKIMKSTIISIIVLVLVWELGSFLQIEYLWWSHLLLGSLIVFLMLYIYQLILETFRRLRLAITMGEEERNKLAVVLASIGDGISIQNTNYQIIYQNELHKTMIGEHLGEYCYRAYQQQEQVCPDCQMALAIQTGQTQTVVKKVETATGTLYVENTVAPIRDGNGIIISAIEVVRNITQRKEVESMLRLQWAAINASMDGVALLNQNGEYTYLNDAHAHCYGYESPAELIGRSWAVLYNEEELARFNDEIMLEFSKKGYWRGEAIGKRKDGSTFPQELSLATIEGNGMVCIIRDITERKLAEQQLSYQAHHDSLTNLPNRALFKERFNLELAHALRNHKMLAVFFMDLDHFKVVNDMMGHAVGDELLNAVAFRLRSCVRDSDTISRLGGDEFTLLLPEISNAEDAERIAEKIVFSFQQPWQLNGQDFRITTSLGVALYPQDGKDADTLLKHADTAMYQAKKLGRNNYQSYHPEMDSKISAKLALESRLFAALQRNELEVFYQPQINTNTSEIIGIEALVRWHHPELGLILPAELIPIAEETGLILPIGEWVMRTACKQNKAWQDCGYPPIKVTANLSLRQFKQNRLLEQVADILATTGLEPCWLELEITESIAMNNVEYSTTIINALKTIGVEIAIDDFGTGYSPLNYLRRFAIKNLKIDRSFIKNIISNPDDAAIVSTLIVLAQNLNLNIIAEGVETSEQLAFLKEHLCQDMQGYLFAKPMPAAEMEKLLQKQLVRL